MFAISLLAIVEGNESNYNKVIVSILSLVEGEGLFIVGGGHFSNRVITVSGIIS